MPLNIKNPKVERLAAEVAAMAKETKTQAIRRALEERKERLELRRFQSDKRGRLQEWLEKEVWPQLPPGVRGRSMSKKETEKILGYGPDGV